VRDWGKALFVATELRGLGDGASNGGADGGCTLCLSAGGWTIGTLCSGTGGAPSVLGWFIGRGSAVACLRIFAIWM
jgi:hypothetical protein